jgi:hypothetical protein
VLPLVDDAAALGAVTDRRIRSSVVHVFAPLGLHALFHRARGRRAETGRVDHQ